MIEFNIAPNTQIGRINIWNPVKGSYDPGNTNGVIPKGEYYLRRDNEDNNFIDVYSDWKYTKFVIRLFLDGPNYNRFPFDKNHWTMKEVKIYKNENFFNTEHYMRAGEYVENLVSDNPIEFGKRWLGLGGFKELSEDMQEYYNKYYTSYSQNGWYGFAHYYPETQELVECPIRDIGDRKATPAVGFSYEPERPLRFYRDLKTNKVNINKYMENKNASQY